jgi:site-specific recombinase XerD
MKNNISSSVIKLIDHVLNQEDLQHWVETPKSLFNKSKSDKMKEVIILMTYLGLRVSEAINFDWTKQSKENKHYSFILIDKGNKPRRVFNFSTMTILI